MLLSSLLLAISVSIDSLGIGITYGIKKTRISSIGKITLFLISFLVTIVAIWFGDQLKNLFSEEVTKWIGASILMGMGLWILYQALNPKEKQVDTKNFEQEKVYRLFIRCFGITIQIIKNPISSDFDNSHRIDGKESLFLGFALSLDAFCIGIGSSIIGLNSILFPFLVATFQFVFLSFGNLLGRKLNQLTTMPDNIWSLVSGCLLIGIAIFKNFI